MGDGGAVEGRMAVCWLRPREAGPKFRHLRKGENLNKSLGNEHFVLIDL